MLVIEQRQLISRKNLVGCDDIIFFEHYVLKLMGLNGTIPILGGWDSSFLFRLILFENLFKPRQIHFGLYM